MHLGEQWMEAIEPADRIQMRQAFMSDFQHRKNFEFEFRKKKGWQHTLVRVECQSLL